MAIPSKTQFAAGGAHDQAILNKFYEVDKPVGNVLYVHHDGSSTGPGFSPGTAYSTLSAAISAATASNNDVILMLPHHNEGLGDAQVTVSKAGLTIKGLGTGTAVPRIDFDHANASIDVTANSVTIENVRLLPSVTAVLIGIDVATGVTDTVLRKIETLSGEDGAGVDEFAKTIDIKAGCTRTKVEDCTFTQHASAAGVLSCVCLTGASDMVEIRGCKMWTAGAGLVAPINGDTTLSTRLLVENCVLVTDAEPGVEVLTGTTGVIRDVDIFSDLATIDAATVADGMAHFRVQYVEVGNEAGTLVKTESVDD
jgi:hypothetical protein